MKWRKRNPMYRRTKEDRGSWSLLEQLIIGFKLTRRERQRIMKGIP